MTKTLIDGKWVQDANKDDSNGTKPKTKPTQDCTKLVAQNQRMATLLHAIEQCTKMSDVRQLIRTAKAAKPN